MAGQPMSIGSLPLRAWAVIVGSALLAMSGLSVFAISGKWLDTAFGVSTGGLGLVAMGFGAFELIASTGSAGFADRIGKFRSTLIGIAMLLGGQIVMVVADEALWIGVIGILTFLCGFEFALRHIAVVGDRSDARVERHDDRSLQRCRHGRSRIRHDRQWLPVHPLGHRGHAVDVGNRCRRGDDVLRGQSTRTSLSTSVAVIVRSTSGAPASTSTVSPGFAAPISTAVFTANQTISSVDL